MTVKAAKLLCHGRFVVTIAIMLTIVCLPFHIPHVCSKTRESLADVKATQGCNYTIFVISLLQKGVAMCASAAKAWQVLLLVTCGFTSLQSLHCHKNRRLRNSDVLLLTTEGPDISEPVEFNAVAERLVSQPRREASSAASSIVAFCPDKCTCDFTNDTNQLRVVCHGHFTENIPLAQLRYNNNLSGILYQHNARNANAYYLIGSSLNLSIKQEQDAITQDVPLSYILQANF